MTRTERSFYPRAVMKDRSESRNTMDKSLKKGGAGAHGWGALSDEAMNEFRALEDEDLTLSDVEGEDVSNVDTASSVSTSDGSPVGRLRSVSSSLSPEELENARHFRDGALKKGELDLGAIARTSSGIPSSPPKLTTMIASDANTTTISPK